MQQNQGIKLVKLNKISDAVFSYGDISLSISKNLVAFPGFCDVHVHFRQPGFSYKETIKSGSMAAAHGGYTAV